VFINGSYAENMNMLSLKYFFAAIEFLLKLADVFYFL